MADAHDPSVMGTIIAIAIALAKVLEVGITWIVKKVIDRDEPTIVQLAPEASQMIRDVHSVTTRTNPEGLPLIYGPRAEVHEVAMALESTAEKVEEIDQKADSIVDAVVKKPQ